MLARYGKYVLLRNCIFNLQDRIKCDQMIVTLLRLAAMYNLKRSCSHASRCYFVVYLGLSVGGAVGGLSKRACSRVCTSMGPHGSRIANSDRFVWG